MPLRCYVAIPPYCHAAVPPYCCVAMSLCRLDARRRVAMPLSAASPRRCAAVTLHRHFAALQYRRTATLLYRRFATLLRRRMLVARRQSLGLPCKNVTATCHCGSQSATTYAC